ncbi:MAG: MBL fold metallo-hydrolase, partial [Candidatus Marinimicrobia bacterium]|nr:MBL fold metallo-hydrolase [Candidatus Neomarinimicrobiota bacterium]
NGPYPLRLIKRIKSRVGHLSNEQAKALFERLSPNGKLRHLILGHLSEKNNDPKIVKKLFRKTVQKIDPKVQLNIALQNKAGPLIEL